MRKLLLTVAAVGVLAAGALSSRADAMIIDGPAALRHAIGNSGLTHKVHCQWGRPHHLRRWGWWDGCYRGMRRGFVIGPSAFFIGARVHWRRRWW